MPTAIVTGASSGIGAATAVQLAARGYAVGITYANNLDGALETARRVKAEGVSAAVGQLDLSEPTRAVETIQQLSGQLGGRLSVLVNSVGLGTRAESLALTAEDFGRALAVNLVGPALCAGAAARLMIDAGTPGRIVHVTSVLAKVPSMRAAAYCAAKAGLEMLMQVTALEWADRGISVVAVAPGHTATPMTGVPDIDTTTDLSRPVIPAGRAADPDEIASVIAHLAVDGSRYLTGTTVTVDGGLLLHSGPEALYRATGR